MNLRQNRAFSHITLIITIIVLIVLAGVAIMFIFGDNGVLTKVTADEVEYNKSEVLEELNTIVTEIYLETYKTAISEEGASIDTSYNAEVVIQKLKSKGIIQNYKNTDGKDVENKYYICTENFKRDITNGIGENGSEKNIFVLELKDDNYVVNYYDNKGEIQTIGSLQIEQNI